MRLPEQDQPQARALLYALTVLHLLCLGLVRPPTAPAHPDSQFAHHAIVSDISLHRS
jgi:hypothetical protein